MVLRDTRGTGLAAEVFGEIAQRLDAPSCTTLRFEHHNVVTGVHEPIGRAQTCKPGTHDDDPLGGSATLEGLHFRGSRKPVPQGQSCRAQCTVLQESSPREDHGRAPAIRLDVRTASFGAPFALPVSVDPSEPLHQSSRPAIPTACEAPRSGSASSTYCSFGSSTQPPVRLLWPPPGTSRRYDQNTKTSESRRTSASPSTYSFSGTRARSRCPATSVVGGDSTGSLTGFGRARAAVPRESVVTATICRFGKAPQGRASRGTSRRLGFFNTRVNSRESRAHRRAVTSTDTEAGSAASADTPARTVAPVANVSTCDRTVNLQPPAAQHRARTCEGHAPRPRFRRATMPRSTTNRPSVISCP